MKRIWLWIVIAFVLGELAYFIADAKKSEWIGIGSVLVLLFGMGIGLFSLLVGNRVLTKTFIGKHKIYAMLLCLSFVFGTIRMGMEYKPFVYAEGEVSLELRIDRVRQSKSSVQIFSKDMLVLCSDDAVIGWKDCEGEKDVAFILQEVKAVLHAGQTIHIKGKYRQIKRATNPGEFDSYLYYKSLSLNSVLYASEIEIIHDEPYGFLQVLGKLKHNGMLAAGRIYEPEAAGFLNAALFGERAMLDEEMNANFQYAGVSHLLAISGLHIGILGLSLYHLLRRKLGFGFVTSGILAGWTLVVYAVLVGGSVSVQRAASMLLIVFVADMLGRSYDMQSAASISAFFILFVSPFQLFGGGFLLSFGAIYAIGGFGLGMQKIFKPKADTIQAKMLSAIVMAVSVFLFTLPIVLYFYFGFSPYSIVLNLICIPLMGLALYSGLAAIVCSFVHLGLAQVVGGLAYFIVACMDSLTSVVRTLPYSFIVIGRPAMWQILCYYAVLGMVYYGVVKCCGEKGAVNPGVLKQWCRGACIRLGFAMWIVFSISAIFILSPLQTGTRIWFLDVGQGDGILIQTEGENILIDCGSTSKKNVGQYVLEPALLSLGIAKLDHVFLTHKDADHINAVTWLAKNSLIEMGNVYISDFMMREMTDVQKDSESGAGKMVFQRIQIISAGFSLNLGESSITCLSPDMSMEYADSNEASLVLAFTQKEFVALLMGDANTNVEYNLLSEFGDRLFDIAVLKLGHHGSSTSSAKEFLATTNPKYAMISYGEKNRYGHPHAVVLESLALLGIEPLETAKQGAILVETNGYGMRVKQYGSRFR